MISDIVKNQVDGIDIWMNSDHMLPTYMTQHPMYDRVLPIIASLLKKKDGFLTLIDIGANIGDTVKLVSNKVNGKFLCIEGDRQYLGILHKNVNEIKDSEIEIEQSYCSDVDSIDSDYKIVRQNGTAKLVNEESNNEKISFKKLDTIVQSRNEFVNANLLKIDTDGFEYKILKGSVEFLKKSSPIIHLEFTPNLYSQNGEKWEEMISFLLNIGYKKALFFDNFGNPLGVHRLDDNDDIKHLISLIDNKNLYYFDLLLVSSKKERKYSELINELLYEISNIQRSSYDKVRVANLEIQSQSEARSQKDEHEIIQLNSKIIKELDKISQLKEKNREIKKELTLNIQNLENDLSQIRNELNSANLSLQDLYQKYSIIINSKGWKIIIKIREIVSRLKNSKLVSSFLRKSNLIPHYKEILKRKIFGRTKIQINKESKKVLYIDHSYHDKTKSTTFFIELLKQHYEVESYWDESWIGNENIDLSFVDDSYLCVIFFQLIPSPDVLLTLKNKNIIFIPMYDAYENSGYEYWRLYENVKVLNFSKTLHKRLEKWGLDSTYLQRFPKPEKKLIQGDNNKVFFYNRNSQINIETCKKLFENSKVSIHIHKTIDPGESFLQPTIQDEKEFNITYSEWFESKEEKWKLARTMGIFVAPRLTEGIGQGFLEAMALGMAVVAPNNPTMNEYIVHNVNGYLYDINNIHPIDLSNISKIQNNAYTTIVNGYNKWEKEKEKIVKLIQKT